MEASENNQLAEPLLASNTDQDQQYNLHAGNKSGHDDLEEIRNFRQFVKYAVEENSTLWSLAAPAMVTSIAQYSLGATTQIFAGHLTTLELDAVSTENMVIAGLAFGIMAVRQKHGKIDLDFDKKALNWDDLMLLFSFGKL